MVGKDLTLEGKFNSGQYDGKTVREVLNLDPIYIQHMIRIKELSVKTDVVKLLERLVKARGMFPRKEVPENFDFEKALSELSEKRKLLKVEIDNAQEAINSINDSAQKTLENPELTDDEKKEIEDGVKAAVDSLKVLQDQEIELEGMEKELSGKQKEVADKTPKRGKKGK